MYLSVSDSAFGCVLGQHDETGKRRGCLLYKQKFYSIRVSLHFVGEKVLCFDVACPEAETLFIFLYYIPHFQNGSTEVYLLENLVDEEYEPLKTYFHDEEVSFGGEDISEEYQGWR